MSLGFQPRLLAMAFALSLFPGALAHAGETVILDTKPGPRQKMVHNLKSPFSLRLEENGELVLWNAKKNGREFATNHPSTRMSYQNYQLIQRDDGYIAIYGWKTEWQGTGLNSRMVHVHHDIWHSLRYAQGCAIVMDDNNNLIIESANHQKLEGIWPRN